MNMPSESGVNGRLPNGRFGTGNRFSRGNPHMKKIHQLKSALLDCVSQDDMRAIGTKLKEMAVDGDIEACKVLLSYSLGRPTQLVMMSAVAGEDNREVVKKIVDAILEVVGDMPDVRSRIGEKLMELHHEWCAEREEMGMGV